MNELQAAAERRKPGAFNDILETEALADWAAKVITSMPNGNLPPGPWGYMTMKNDDWGYVRTPENDIVANTSTSAEGREFYDSVCAEFGFGSPEWKAGPAKARAVAELLIWAQGVVRVTSSPGWKRDPKVAELQAKLATLEAENERLRSFARDIASNYDHENDAHRHNNGACRKCNAEEVLSAALTKEQP